MPRPYWILSDYISRQMEGYMLINFGLFSLVEDRSSPCGQHGYPYALQDHRGQFAKFHDLETAKAMARLLEDKHQQLLAD